jgi:peptide/nickel transport system substrate-binding protein
MAIVAAGALVLSACTSDSGEEPEDTQDAAQEGDSETGTDDGSETSAPEAGGDEGSTAKPDLGDVQTVDDNINYSVGADEWQGYNPNTPETNSVYNSVITGRLSSGFWYWGTDGTVYPREEFGTYEMTSEDPLTIEYTISDEAVWEDGTPVTYDDYLLEWAAQNPNMFGELGEEEAPLFNHVSSDFGTYVPDGPQGESGGKTFTVEYPEPYPDWELLVGGPTGPAHVAAREAGMELADLTQALQDADKEALTPVAEFWNEGWLSPDKALPSPDVAPSYGEYSLDGATWEAGQFLTLVPNESWWGVPPATANLTFRFAAPETHVQALQNGDLNIIEPQATVDTVQQIEALGDSVTLLRGDELTFEHLDYNFAEGSPFAESEGGLAAREAFAMCVPRQQIVDNLIKPINPEAVVMNSREVFPFQEGYQEMVDAIYDGRYDEVDLEGAKAKFQEAGLEDGVEIRIGYGAGNQRRTDEVALIKASCDQVGFNIIDASGPTLGDVLASGDWEIAMFGWAGSGTVTGSAFWYQSDGSGNFGLWNSPEADAAWDTISTSLDEEVQKEQLQIVEKAAWDDLHSIPVFAFPGVVAHAADIENVIFNSTQTQIAWNAEQWVRSQ